jgi:two-component system LytT family sensor kinase
MDSHFFSGLYLCSIQIKTLKKFLFILVQILAINLMAQQNPDKETKSSKANSSQTMKMIDEANKLSKTNATKSMQIATDALERSLKLDDKTSEYYSYNTLGTLYYNVGNFSKASSYFSKARAGFQKIKDSQGLTYAEKYLALSLEKERKYADALLVNESYDKNSAKSKKKDYVKSKYENAKLKSKAGKKEEAISDLKTLAKDSNLSAENKIDIYKELGDLYVANKDTANAYRAYNQVLTMDNSGKQNGYSISSGLVDVAKKVSDLNLKNGRAADNFIVQNMVLMEGLKSNDPFIIQAANYNIGTTYLSQSDEESAIPYLKKSAKIAKTQGNAREEQKSVKDLAKAYENLGQYDKALDIYKRYVRLSDSFKSLQNGNEEASLALNREFLKQEARIKGLMTTQKEKEASIRRQRTILWTLAAVLIVFAFLTWALVRNIRQKQKANMVIQLQSLRTQMNPHFIFNSLNSVNNFISKNDERSANKYISDFSKLMRTVLKNSDQDFIGLVTEIETLRIYLELEHFRFGDKFDYELQVASNVEPESVQVPPMLIQPYIENAIWHGLRYKEEKGMLWVNFFIEDKKLYCTIHDNGIGRKKSAELKTLHQKTYQSTGIKNTKERIELLNKLHKTNLGIEITDLEENSEAAGTMVKISLPYIMETADMA